MCSKILHSESTMRFLLFLRKEMCNVSAVKASTLESRATRSNPKQPRDQQSSTPPRALSSKEEISENINYCLYTR